MVSDARCSHEGCNAKVYACGAPCCQGKLPRLVCAQHLREIKESQRPPAEVGIPTVYEGYRFRSRVEARWAAFFDLAGWRWWYEPLDLKGYIPDFVLDLPRGPTLIEVKATLVFDELAEHVPKVEQSGWAEDYIIVGGALWEGRHNLPSMGLGGQRGEFLTPAGTIHPFGWGDTLLGLCGACNRVSFFHWAHDQRCASCGHRAAFKAAPRRLWAEATNRVQWRGA